ncbi:MAG: hypothetical protein ABJC12_00310, partial [Saprospiraceae bacterium]
GDVINEADNCSTGLNATFTDVITNGPCEGSKVITRTWHLVDNCGNAAANQIQTITVSDNTPPTFTRPANIVIFTSSTCTYDASVAATGDVINEADNCSTGLNATFTDVITNGPCEGSKVITRTWHLVDNCGNAAADQVQTITVSDDTAPTFTRPANTTIFTSTTCTFDASVAATGDVSDEADNCSTGLNATFTDVTVAGPCQGSQVITRTWHLIDNCGNAAANQIQTITVSDNLAPVILPGGSINACYETVAQAFAAAIAATSATDNCSAVTKTADIFQPLIPGCDSIIRVYVTDACGNVSSKDYNTMIGCQVVRLKVFLEGPYYADGDTMSTRLNYLHVLPGQTPISGVLNSTPAGQPYNTAPWNYNMNTGTSYGDTPLIPYPADVVDWVLVTVRKDSYTGIEIWKCAGWVHNNGVVTFPDNCPGPAINTSDMYYIMVEHRNHLAIMSPSFVDINCNGAVLSWDFTTSNSYAPPFRYGQKHVVLGANGRWAMYEGNGEQANSRAAISSPDRSLWRSMQNYLGYAKGDFNMNAAVGSEDESFWKPNQNITTGIIWQ